LRYFRRSNEELCKIAEIWEGNRYPLGDPDKVETFKEYIELYNINPEQVLYMGDDIPDYQ
jgi:3-deoxy-D-manno-octulosonate 8-phosphate phosphatase KdsC-like HAD superfamily phosphatase